MSHRNARTTPVTRTEMGMLRASGLSLRQIGRRYGVSHETARRWCERFAAGQSLEDRSSRPRRMPRLTPPEIEQVVLDARREMGLGPAMLEGYLGIAGSMMADETTSSCVAAFEQSAAWFACNGITIERVMTDNGAGYKKRWREAVQGLGMQTRYTRPYRPQTNGKAERLIQTLLREWAYTSPFTSNAARCAALPRYLDHYNTRRYHTSCKSTPWQRAASDLAAVNNVRGHYT